MIAYASVRIRPQIRLTIICKLAVVSIQLIVIASVFATFEMIYYMDVVPLIRSKPPCPSTVGRRLDENPSDITSLVTPAVISTYPTRCCSSPAAGAATSALAAWQITAIPS